MQFLKVGMGRSTAVIGLLSAVFAMGLSADQANAEVAYGVTQSGSLVQFDTTDPSNILSGFFVSGLQTNETIQGLDFRPATGQLYGLGASSRLYTINAVTGVATQVAGAFAPALNGSALSFDFNPVIDRIRVVSDANQNLVLNPNTGTVQLVATNVFYGPADPNVGQDPNVIHSAYTNNFDGATTTQLYGVDTGLDILVTQANNAGTLGTVGSLGVNVVATGGFDISGVTGIAYLVAQPNGSFVTTLYTVNLATGATLAIEEIGGGAMLTAFTVAIPEPSSLASLALLAGMLIRRRRV